MSTRHARIADSGQWNQTEKALYPCALRRFTPLARNRAAAAERSGQAVRWDR
jgi:hypothetical protein